MNKARVRVEAKRMSNNASKSEKDMNLKNLLRAFNKACKKYGIIKEYNEREYFTRKCDIDRKKREMKLAIARGDIKAETEGEEKDVW